MERNNGLDLGIIVVESQITSIEKAIEKRMTIEEYLNSMRNVLNFLKKMEGKQ